MKQVKTAEVSIGEIGLKSGLGISILLVIYFMVMKYFNFIDREIAWSFNFIILFVGIVFTYRYYRSKTQPIIDYISGLILGCTLTATSVIPYALFVYGYFSKIDPFLLIALKSNVLFMGEQITPGRAATATLIEGTSSGVMMSFIIMQYYKAGFKRVQSKTETRG